MRPRLLLLPFAAAALTLTGCGTGSSPAPATSSRAASPSSTSAAAASSAPQPVSPTSPASPTTATPTTTSPASPVSATTASGAAAAVDPCTLLTAKDVTAVLGEAPAASRTQSVGRIPTCQWISKDQRVVQVANVEASVWAQQLPAMIRAIEGSPLAKGDNLRKIREAADLVAQGRTIEPARACELFSRTLVIGGQKAGDTTTIRILPDKRTPLGITGQSCVDGRFSTVALLSQSKPLSKPIPVRPIESALTKVEAAGRG